MDVVVITGTMRLTRRDHGAEFGKSLSAFWLL
jgi:hypothetical protein